MRYTRTRSLVDRDVATVLSHVLGAVAMIDWIRRSYITCAYWAAWVLVEHRFARRDIAHVRAADASVITIAIQIMQHAATR